MRSCLIPGKEGPVIDDTSMSEMRQVHAGMPHRNPDGRPKRIPGPAGGKLGRHPQLAKELPGIYDENRVMEIVKDCLRFYKDNSKQGERFGQILTPADFEAFAARYKT